MRALDNLAPPLTTPLPYDDAPWPRRVARTWHSVRTGTPATDAADEMWPYYIHQVRTHLTAARSAGTERRAALLSSTHRQMHVTLTALGATR
ncbi:hypothetical protein [Streptomyces sp. SM12]|uniref:hypothetical protein n=1 Tax=Streptomyces sp. SM12 TaxID=1071602 RepID=UPI0021564977|nr:hypothetical protein [Streptomyces sp. SM12]